MDKKIYNEYLEIVKKITKHDEKSEDLLHDVLIQLSENKKYQELNQFEKKWFFIRTIQNQYNSKTSSFYRQYKKHVFEQIQNIEIIDEEYIEPISIEDVNNFLDSELNKNPNKWYEIGLFKMYMKEKKIDLINKKTRIPKYSIRLTINDMKKWIQQKIKN